jgi:hypothetical protein
VHITFAALQELEFMCCTLNSAAFNLLACTFEVEILFACKDQILLPAWLPFLHCFPFKHCFRSAVIVNEARVRSPKLLCKTCMLMFTHAPALLKMCHWNAKLDVTSLKCQTQCDESEMPNSMWRVWNAKLVFTACALLFLLLILHENGYQRFTVPCVSFVSPIINSSLPALFCFSF